MNGEVTEVYSNEMPSQAFLTNAEIAAVLTYICKNFGNKASAVSIAEVTKTPATIKK